MDYSYFRCCCVPVASHYWRRGNTNGLQDHRIEYTGRWAPTPYRRRRTRVRISGFKVWQIGADRLIASSQGHFDSSEYHRQLERGCRNHNKPSANADSSDAGQLIRINELVLQCDATLHYNVVHEDGSIQLAFI
jgi:hypothetical protein